jgi:hypothetical protein
LPPTASKHLGVLYVSGYSLLETPAAKINAFIIPQIKNLSTKI